MKTTRVKDIMVPLSAYATVAEDATLNEAVAALKASRDAFDQGKYRHRAILILDAAGKVVGKVSLLAILRGLEPKYDQMLSDRGAMHVGFTMEFQRSMIEQLKLWTEPLEDLCQKAARVKVKSFMSAPSNRELISPEATLNEAIHQFVMGHHQSLLVKSDDTVVGVLRLTDVYDIVAQAVAECKL